MPITITLPTELETQLQRKAQAQNRSVEELALDLLTEALEVEEDGAPFEHDKVYYLHTPYNSFGAAQALVRALEESDETEP